MIAAIILKLSDWISSGTGIMPVESTHHCDKNAVKYRQIMPSSEGTGLLC